MISAPAPAPGGRAPDGPTPDGPAGGRRTPVSGWVLAGAWLAYFGMLQWSVVQFRLPIVATLVVCAGLLTGWLWRRVEVRLTPATVSVMLAGSALLTWVVHLYSYVPAPWFTAARLVLAGGAVAAALLLRSTRPGRADAGLAVAVAAYTIASMVIVVADPAPRIDVWVTLQQASDALGHGVNFYRLTWVDSPGVSDAFTYLPWTAVLLAPGRWLLGDVRWALLVWTLVAAWGAVLLARGRARAGGRDGRWLGAAVAALLLLAPGTLTQVDQAWTEPLLLAGIVWWAVLVQRDHAWWAIVPLALACASKQHLLLLLPILLLWRPFGARRAVTTGLLACLLVLPWVLVGPADIYHDTIGLLVTFHPIRFANTLYLLALNQWGVTLPFWLTGLAVLGVLGAAAWAVWRRQPALDELLRWLALVLLVANLVNKQAFYNQFWLVGAVVVVSLAAATLGRRPTPTRSSTWPITRSPDPTAAGDAPSAAT